MCLHYFSDALGLQFGNLNEEVYNIDQIKEWAPPQSKWLEPPGPLRMSFTLTLKFLTAKVAHYNEWSLK